MLFSLNFSFLLQIRTSKAECLCLDLRVEGESCLSVCFQRWLIRSSHASLLKRAECFCFAKYRLSQLSL